MTINWGALGSVAAVSFVVGVVVVALVSLALVGLSARAAAEEAPGRLSPGAGAAVAALCLAAASAIVVYGFYLLIFWAAKRSGGVRPLRWYGPRDRDPALGGETHARSTHVGAPLPVSIGRLGRCRRERRTRHS